MNEQSRFVDNKSSLNGANTNLNESFNLGTNFHESIEVNMFTSFHKDSMNFEELNRISTDHNINKKEQHIPPTKKKRKNISKLPMNIAPIDPKLYRVSIEDIKKTEMPVPNTKKEKEKEKEKDKDKEIQIQIPLPRINSALNGIKTKSSSGIQGEKEIKSNQEKAKQEYVNKSNTRSDMQTANKKNIALNVYNAMKLNFEKASFKKPICSSVPQKCGKKTIQITEIAHTDSTCNIASPVNIITEPKNTKMHNLNTKCVYCLRNVKYPVILACNHELCMSCAREIKSLNSFQKGREVNYITCPRCMVKTSIVMDLSEILKKDWTQGQEWVSDDNQTYFCEICPNTKIEKDMIEFECLNCDIFMCYECRVRHSSNKRHQNHKVVQVSQFVQEAIEKSLCEIHKEPLINFCITDNVPCCSSCGQSFHSNTTHLLKPVQAVIKSAFVELGIILKECEVEIYQLEEAISQMTYTKERILCEQDHFVSKLKNIFDDLFSIMKFHHDQIKNSIIKVFSDNIDKLNTQLSNFSYVKSRHDYYRTLLCGTDIEILDQIKQIRQLNELIHKLEKKGLFPSEKAYLHHKDFSLMPSVFSIDPSSQLQKLMSAFSFIPLTEKIFDVLRIVFKSSKIISRDLITSELILTLPRIISGNLLYQISKDGSSPLIFHELCDNKGPTLVLVKTATGHIFGGYSPISWISELIYNECEKAFIFSITDGKFRKPIRCNVKNSMKKYAIKQNSKEYSPGFGETDKADLFISFKNLKNSYSNLGNVYKCPREYTPWEFLAGKPNDWEISEVEVYAIEVKEQDEMI